MNAKKLVLYCILIQFNYAAAYNILAIVSLPLKSHYMAFDRFFRELAIRGHSVTVMNNYVGDNLPANMTFVDLSRDRIIGQDFPPMTFYDSQSGHTMRLLNIYRHYALSPEKAQEDCENLLVNKEVKSLLAKNKKFDVIFVEQFMGDCGIAFAGAFFDAPIIGITSHTLLPWAYSRLGIQFDFSSDAAYFSSGGRNPSLYHKIEGYLTNIFMKYVEKTIHGIIHGVFKKHLPHLDMNVLDVVDKRMKMMFVYQHYSVTGARLSSPQLLEIGGIHIGEEKPIPQDIEEFLSTADHGAIFVSFGSNLKASTMNPKMLQAFIGAFSRIPQKVLWKLETPLSEKNNNILTKSWLPQRDILCHPKVLAFVSHGGMLSLSETAHCGKPLLAIPFFGDQFSNAAVVRDSGLGIMLYFNDVTTETLMESIKNLTGNELQQNARNIQKLWLDRPMNVLDSAIYWTEYVARHRTSPPSLPSKKTSWFESTLLDVYFVLISIVILFLIVIFSLIRLVSRMLFSKTLKKKQE